MKNTVKYLMQSGLRLRRDDQGDIIIGGLRYVFDTRVA